MESCFDLECYVWLKDKLLKIDYRIVVYDLVECFFEELFL